jgi:hypothetical protein
MPTRSEWYSAARRPRRRVSSFTLSVAAFVVLCGLVLLVAGSSWTGGCSGRPASAGPAQRVASALREVQAAEEALDGANYGKVKSHIRSARDNLTSLLAEMESR